MHVCATLGSTATRLRDKYTKKESKEKKSQSRFCSRMRGGALVHLIAMDVCIFVWVTNVINHVYLGGCRLRSLVLRRVEFRLFP
jgi:hypothetical protein